MILRNNQRQTRTKTLIILKLWINPHIDNQSVFSLLWLPAMGHHDLMVSLCNRVLIHSLVHIGMYCCFTTISWLHPLKIIDWICVWTRRSPVSPPFVDSQGDKQGPSLDIIIAHLWKRCREWENEQRGGEEDGGIIGWISLERSGVRKWDDILKLDANGHSRMRNKWMNAFEEDLKTIEVKKDQTRDLRWD